MYQTIRKNPTSKHLHITCFVILKIHDLKMIMFVFLENIFHCFAMF